MSEPTMYDDDDDCDDETGPLSVDEREALVDWITRHRAEAGAAWASRLLAAYDAAYDAVATRSPAASLGEPAERPTDTGPGSASDKAKALLQLEALFGAYPMATGYSHLAGLVIRDAVKGKAPSVSGSVREETPANQPRKLNEVEAKAVAEFVREMETDVIPAVVEMQRVRQALAVESRKRIVMGSDVDELRQHLENANAYIGKLEAQLDAVAEVNATPSSARVSEDAPGDEPMRTHCHDCDRPTLCDIILRGSGPCGQNAGMAPAASNLYLDTKRDLTALRADRDRLREAFARYATHDPFCPRGLHGGSLDDDACECGFISVRGLADSSSPSSATLEKP